MADRDRNEDDRHVALGEVLRALGAELTAATPGGLGLDGATLELDVSVEAGPDGAPVFRVPTSPGGGGKRRRTARLAVTLRSPEPTAQAGPGRDEAGTNRSPAVPDLEPLTGAAAPPPAPTTPDRAPGLLDLLADTLRNLSESASRPAPGRSPWGLPPDGEDPPATPRS